MMQRFFLVLVLCFFSILAYGQKRGSKKKKNYEFIDLGALQVEGKICYPNGHSYSGAI